MHVPLCCETLLNSAAVVTFIVGTIVVAASTYVDVCWCCCITVANYSIID